MNFLAHFRLAEQTPDGWAGAWLGDFVKGRVDGRYPPSLARGIMLHRRIDSFTDGHRALARSRSAMSPARRRFAGVLLDVFHDHFLARRWHRHGHRPLPEFAAQVYAGLDACSHAMPETARRVAARMGEQDWLSGYGDPVNVDTALRRMATRLRRRGAHLAGGIEELHGHYEVLEADFDRFFPEVVAFAREEKRRLGIDAGPAC